MTGLRFLVVAFCSSLRAVSSALVATENSTYIAISNERLSFTVDKSNGFLGHVHLDGYDLQGPQSDSSGRGYYECHCVPNNYQVNASDIFLVGKNSTYTLLQGEDKTGTPYAGVFLQEIVPVGHTFQQWYFLRAHETGLHNFARLLYANAAAGLPFEDGGLPVREIREVFQFNSTLWQTASTNPAVNVSIPQQSSISPAVQVQDATWSLAGTPDEPFVQETADTWTKYFLADAYRYRRAHGLYGVAGDGTAYGAWMVSVTQDTLFGGPTHYDLLLDGMIGVPERSANLVRIPHIYYYFASSHQGAATSNLTSEGYDRTWGPQMLYFNKGANASLPTLRADAEARASLSAYASFYDSIAHLVPNFEPPSTRGAVALSLALPHGAEDAVAVLSAEGYDFQSNVLDKEAYQYWGEVDQHGQAKVEGVRPGKYRLTVYAKGVFGSFIQEGVVVESKKTTPLSKLRWEEESSGTELWRIGTPDRTAGEYKHGFERAPNKSFHPEQYRVYWGTYNFTQDFPDGVHFKVGTSDVRKDWNYAQFSEVGGDLLTSLNVTGEGQQNNFTITFDVAGAHAQALARATNATLTVSLAGASGATGNEDFSSAQYANFPLYLRVNERAPLAWEIPSNVSSSCVTRSGISCFVIGHQYRFDAGWLREGGNAFELGLVPGSGTRVMYDALRLELQ